MSRMSGYAQRLQMPQRFRHEDRIDVVMEADNALSLIGTILRIAVDSADYTKPLRTHKLIAPSPRVATMPRDDVAVSEPYVPEADLLGPYAILALLARAFIAGSIIATAAWLLIGVVLDRVG
jgi:hypothetical protein